MTRTCDFMRIPLNLTKFEVEIRESVVLLRQSSPFYTQFSWYQHSSSRATRLATVRRRRVGETGRGSGKELQAGRKMVHLNPLNRLHSDSRGSARRGDRFLRPLIFSHFDFRFLPRFSSKVPRFALRVWTTLRETAGDTPTRKQHLRAELTHLPSSPPPLRRSPLAHRVSPLRQLYSTARPRRSRPSVRTKSRLHYFSQSLMIGSRVASSSHSIALHHSSALAPRPAPLQSTAIT